MARRGGQQNGQYGRGRTFFGVKEYLNGTVELVPVLRRGGGYVRGKPSTLHPQISRCVAALSPVSNSNATFAALCSAAFLLPAVPRPTARSPTYTSTVNRRLWPGPSSETSS